MRHPAPESESSPASTPRHRAIQASLAALALVLLLPSGPGGPIPSAFGQAPRTLSFAQRVEARRAIEGVFWAHRDWPKDNGDAKPSLDQWLTKGAMEREVEDDLRKSDALARYWGRPITGEALQAELDRMMRDSGDPGMLREILAALHDDAFVAAEILARHSLADRLILQAYNFDGRIHGETARRAAEALANASSLERLRRAGDEFATSRLQRGPEKIEPHQAAVEIVEYVPEEDWSARVERIGDSQGVRGRDAGDTLGRLRIAVPGALVEGEREFTSTAVTSVAPDRIGLATGIWRKRAFDDWWKAERERYSREPAVPATDYTLAPLAPGNPCTNDILSPNDTWYPLKRAVPSARHSAATVWTGSEMLVWGGDNGTIVLNDGFRYRPATDTWVPMSGANAPTSRARSAVVWTGTEMIVAGGDAAGSFPVGGGRYDPAADTWTPLPSPFSIIRTRATAVWTGSTMIVWGGNDSAGNRLNTGFIYNPAANTVTSTSTTNAPLGRIGHTATWLNGEMVVWGGDVTNIYVGDGGRYNPGTDSWATMSTANAPLERAYHSATVVGNRIVIWGGLFGSNGTRSDGKYYTQNTWTNLPTTGAPPSARYKHSAVFVDAGEQGGFPHLIIFGGQSLNGFTGLTTELNDGAVMRPEDVGWQAINNAGAPAGRHNASAVAAGSRLLVWGGAVGKFDESVLGDGRIYDPILQAWSGVSNSGTPGPVPSPRVFHTVSATGSEVIVWGGINLPSGIFPSSHAKYVPALDEWQSIPQTDAPVQVANHTATWTGSRLFVWGGEIPAGTTTNAGAFFDLTTWEGMDPTGAPVARRNHSAVWAGAPIRSLIVWGGFNDHGGAVPLQDGGRFFYNPAVLQIHWDPPPAAAGLINRGYHSAVWTGTQMIIFGGENGTIRFNDGASYNPLGNAWAALPPANAPAARSRHAVVWTGNEMLVWGGNGFGGNLADGARFTPSTSTWQSLPSVGLAGRQEPAATWTGSEMIVWGGMTNAQRAFDGARYNLAFGGWSPMSQVGAPGGRWHHGAAQVGTEMYTWGGEVASGFVTDTGGRYCASCASLAAFEAGTDLQFGTDNATMTWTGNGGVTAYGLYRGTLGGAPGYNHACLQSNLAAATASDAAIPAPGTAYYYLVAAKNACSSTSLGKASNGTPRPNAAPCP